MNDIINQNDLIILGGGPAGLTSAIFAARAGIDTLIIENSTASKSTSNSTVENYPGFLEITGDELSHKMREQAIKLGAKIEKQAPIKGMFLSDEKKEIETSNKTYDAKSVIIATGAYTIPLPVNNEEKFRSKGIHYNAESDGGLYKGKDVFVVCEEHSLDKAYFLSKLANEVTIITRKSSFDSDSHMLEKILTKDNIKIMYNSEVSDVEGKKALEAIIVKKTSSTDEIRFKADAVFVFLGTKTSSSLFNQYIALDKSGHITTNEKMMTNVSGVFAVGDIRAKEHRQLTTAVSDGTIAALEAERYLLN